MRESELRNGQRHSFDWSRISRLLQPENLSRVSRRLTSSGVKMRESPSAGRCKLARAFFWKVSVARLEW